MKNLALLILIILFSLSAFSQNSKPKVKDRDASATPEATPELDEKEELKKAIALSDPVLRVNDLKKFLSIFPETEQKNRVLGLIVSGRAEIAADKLRFQETKEGIELFKLAVKEAPTPMSEKLFTRVVLQIPTNLFWSGQNVAALEVAKLIEEKIVDNQDQMLALATFYLSIERAESALKLAQKTIELNPKSKVAYQTLGLAYRMNFDLEKSIEAYQKVLELDAETTSAIRSLAEMKRATGKTAEAIELYEKLLEKDSNDLNAKTGIILSLFDKGDIAEAESRLKASLEEKPDNLLLLVGAAYWYARNEIGGDKTVDYAQRALAIEPRYTWAYIAMARGLIKQGKPVTAETTLLTAKQYGNFPTLEYEIANARLAAGFYKDAADELRKSFKLEDGKLKTKLGGRLEKEADNFTDLLSLERQASIFQPYSADKETNAEKLKILLAFAQKIENKNAKDTEIIETADEFINGDDKMKTHRQIYVANQLLLNKKAIPKVLEITKEATAGVDEALNINSPSSAVLADQLYETRKIAFSRGSTLVVPTIPQKTLASIIRGRIEELAGWALFQQEKKDEALVRLKRAISILPKDSVWLRSTHWKMGTILETQGKEKEALNNYIKGYALDAPDEVKMLVIETVYKKLNGSLDGLKERMESPQNETQAPSIFVKKDETQADLLDKTVSKNDETPTKTNSDEVPVTKNNGDIPTLDIPEDLNLKDSENTTKETTENRKKENADSTDNKETPFEKTNEDIKPKTTDETKLVNKESKKDDSNLNENNVESENIKNTVLDEKKSVNAEDSTKGIQNSKPNEEKTSDNTKKSVEDELIEKIYGNKIKTDESTKENKSNTETKTEEKAIIKPNLGTRPLVVVEDKLSNTTTEFKDPNNPKIKKEEKKKSANNEVSTENKEEKENPENKINLINNEKPDDSKTEENKSDELKSSDQNKNNEVAKTENNSDDLEKTIKVEDLTRPNDKSDDETKKTSEITNKKTNNDDQKTTEKIPEKKVETSEESKINEFDLDNLFDVKPKNNEEDVKEKPKSDLKDKTSKPFENVESPKSDTEDKKLEDNNEKPKVENTVEKQNVSNVSTFPVSRKTRPRIVVVKKEDESNTSVKTKTENMEDKVCKVITSQDIVSVINNGGSQGLLVGVSQEVEDLEVTAKSNSPKDVEVVFEPGIGTEAKRAFFVIRSKSRKQGIFTINLKTPCGEKEIIVKVR